MTAQQVPGTTLGGPALVAARLAWAVGVVAIVVLWSLGTAALLTEPPPDCTQVTCDPVDFNAGDLEVAEELDLPAGFLKGPFVAISAIVPAFLFFAIAGLIFWRRSNDWMGLVVSFSLVTIGGLLFTSSNDAFDRTYPELAPIMGAISGLAYPISVVGLFYLFPNGRFVPRWTRWVASVAVTTVVLGRVLPLPSQASEAIALSATLAIFVTGPVAQIYRYRRASSPVERQQTKWVVIGLMGAAGLALTWFVVATMFPPEKPAESRVYALLVAVPLIMVLIFLLPLSFAVSILRYRLWDIDILVNRALVYGTLTGTLATGYIGSVLLLQVAFSAVTDQGGSVAIVASTLAIAALFQPLRRRIQAVIDQRFYRRRYDAARALAAFGTTARDEVELPRLSDALVGVVQQTMQPEHVSLWLREQGDKR